MNVLGLAACDGLIDSPLLRVLFRESLKLKQLPTWVNGSSTSGVLSAMAARRFEIETCLVICAAKV